MSGPRLPDDEPRVLDGRPAPEHASRFLAERPRLVGLAYRLLGSLSDAEDVVQEAWFRWDGADRAAIERPAAWLTTVVSRLGLDRLRSRQRDRADYVGPWLPEPFIEPMADSQPERAAELSDSLTTAFLVMLERLTPEERLVLLLVDVFGEPFRSVAPTLQRSEDACRQLASRARRKVRSEPERHSPAAAEQLAIASLFVAAVMSGDIEQVKSMLTPTAVLTSDGGANRHAARRPVVGPERIARFVTNMVKRQVEDGFDLAPVWVNGSPGMIVSVGGRPLVVSVIETLDGLVDRYYWIVNPDKLGAIGRTIDLV